MQLKDWLKRAGDSLHSSSDSPRLDAELLACLALDKPRSYLHTWPEAELDEAQLSRLQQLLAQRQAGTPMAHITGKREFWSLDLYVSPATLIPRPETETLVSFVLQHYPAEPALSLVDLGTGSGAIALALASERRGWDITATDISPAALAVARRNAEQLALPISLLQSHWLEQLGQQRFDLIISNPPYIAENDPHLLQGDVRHEPLSALVSGEDGLDAIRQIAIQAPAHLQPGGALLMEHGYDQKDGVRKIFAAVGYHGIIQLQDDGGNPRMTFGVYE